MLTPTQRTSNFNLIAHLFYLKIHVCLATTISAFLQVYTHHTIELILNVIQLFSNFILHICFKHRNIHSLQHGATQCYTTSLYVIIVG